VVKLLFQTIGFLFGAVCFCLFVIAVGYLLKMGWDLA